MRIIVHGGLGKTATTWLQTIALPKMDVISLGKGHCGENESHPTPALRAAFYETFSPIYSPSDMYRRFRNTRPLVQAYASELEQFIRGNKHFGQSSSSPPTAVLSDEGLLCYGGHEVNMAPLVMLVRYLHYAFREESVRIDVVLTIREQRSWLESFYAYDYANQKRHYATFRSFIEAGLTNPEQGVFSLLSYDDSLTTMKDVLPEYVSIRFVPYEILIADGAKQFLNCFFGLGEGESLGGLDQVPSIVVNESVGFLRDQYRSRVLASRIRAGLGRRRSGSRLLRGLECLASSQVSLALFPENKLRIRKEVAALSAIQWNQVGNLYASANRRVGDLLGLDLGQLGYSVQASP